MQSSQQPCHSKYNPALYSNVHAYHSGVSSAVVAMVTGSSSSSLRLVESNRRLTISKFTLLRLAIDTDNPHDSVYTLHITVSVLSLGVLLIPSRDTWLPWWEAGCHDQGWLPQLHFHRLQWTRYESICLVIDQSYNKNGHKCVNVSNLFVFCRWA